MRWVSSHFQLMDFGGRIFGTGTTIWLASVALGNNLVVMTSCTYPPELGKAQRRILSIQH